MSRRVDLRTKASADIDHAIGYLAEHADTTTAAAFIDELEAGTASIRDWPGMGSPRFAGELDLPGLRAWRLDRFGHVIFYRFDDEHVDIWRVLHDRRDLPDSLSEPNDLDTA